MEKERKINISGCEIVSLAGSLAICLADKLCDDDLRALRFFLNTLSSNLTIIDLQGRQRKSDDKNSSK